MQFKARIRKIENRGARGSNRTGLKIGKDSILELSEQETIEFIEQIKRNILGSNYSYKKSKSYYARRKHFKDLKRVVRLIRKKSFPVPLDQTFEDSALLESFCLSRKEKWKEIGKRKANSRVELKNFSFIDDPIGTYKKLKKITECEARSRTVFIDFMDERCMDIAPYMVLGLMRQDMAQVFAGGHINRPISDVLRAVNMLEMLRINLLHNQRCTFIFPFKIRSRRKKGTSVNDNLATAETTEEKVANNFTDTFNEWLMNLPIPLELTDAAYVNISLLFGELLDNAKRHSDVKNSDGDWHISGFMEMKPGGDPANPQADAEYVCHFSIISIGDTIYESLKTAPENIVSSVERYCSKLPKSSVNEEEILWNLCALQDGISRTHPTPENPKNGYGLMLSLVALMNFFGASQDPEKKPQMTIISGNSCIMVKYPYNTLSGEEGKRVLAFNKGNTLDKPPDKDHVFSLPGRFPGTLITVRFVMDNDDLVEMAREENADA